MTPPLPVPPISIDGPARKRPMRRLPFHETPVDPQFQIIRDPGDAFLWRVREVNSRAYIAPAVSDYGLIERLLAWCRSREAING